MRNGVQIEDIQIEIYKKTHWTDREKEKEIGEKERERKLFNFIIRCLS